MSGRPSEVASNRKSRAQTWLMWSALRRWQGKAQPFLAPEPLNPFPVHAVAFVADDGADPAEAEARKG